LRTGFLISAEREAAYATPGIALRRVNDHKICAQAVVAEQSSPAAKPLCVYPGTGKALLQKACTVVVSDHYDPVIFINCTQNQAPVFTSARLILSQIPCPAKNCVGVPLFVENLPSLGRYRIAAIAPVESRSRNLRWPAELAHDKDAHSLWLEPRADSTGRAAC